MTRSTIFSLRSPLNVSGRLVRDWRFTVAREVCGLNIEPLNDGQINIDARIVALDKLVYAGWKSTPLLTSRDPENIRDGNDMFSLTFSSKPHYFVQYGEESSLGAGATRILRLGEPCKWGAADQIDVASVVIPPKLLEARIPNIADLIKRPLSLNEGAGRLLSDYGELIGKHLEPADDATRRVMATHMIDLLVLAMAPSGEAKEQVRNGGLKSLRRAAIMGLIEKRFSDTRLNLRDAAEKLGLSPRYVQLLLEEEGTSFSKLLRAERILRAVAMLCDPSCDHMRIVDIAFATGFSDLSTFNRAFRQETGDTPSAARMERRSGRVEAP